MRLFVAILLDEQVRSALKRVQDELAPSCDGVRWVRWDQLHLTLKFLGEVGDRDVPGVSGAVARAAEQGRPFEMTLARSGCFPPGGGVRIVWAGIEEASGALLGCAQAVENELAALGFPKERRPFSAHITIGRVKDDRSGGRIRSAVKAHAFDAVVQPVERVTLMSSVLSPQGPTYSVVSDAGLCKDEG